MAPNLTVKTKWRLSGTNAFGSNPHTIFAYGRGLIETRLWLAFSAALELTDEGQYDLAEKTLNEYYEAHKDADSDDWLRNSVLSALANVRRTKGDY